METQKHITCKSCGNNFTGTYCNVCGEKVIKPSDRTLLHFFSQLFEAFTFIDNKFFRTLRLLFTKPGFLSKEYIEGRTVRYLKPLSVFLIANLFYFLFPSIDVFNSHLISQIVGQPYSESIYSTYQHIAEEKGYEASPLYVDEYGFLNTIIDKDFAAIYNQKASSISKTTIFVLVFAFSLITLLLNFYKKKYYYEHLTVALHFISFILFATLLFGYIIAMIITIARLAGFNVGDRFFNSEWVMVPVILLIVYYIAITMKRVYNDKMWLAIPKGLIAVIGFIFSIILYRYILFHLTIYSI